MNKVLYKVLTFKACISSYLKGLFKALQGKPVIKEVLTSEVKEQVVRTCITAEEIKNLRVNFPVVRYSKDTTITDLAFSAGEQKVIDYLERRGKPNASTVSRTF